MVRALVILIAVLLSSCQTLTLQKTLDIAERQLLECPDSALTTVRSINKSDILKPSHRAQYGVIYSAALDKNRINITSDSLIRFSVDYYDIFGSPEQRMRAYYYLGRTQKHAGEIMPATLSFLDAAQYTDQVDDNYLKGLLYSELGEVYILHMQYKKAYNYFEQSYNYYKAEDMPMHYTFQLYEMGYVLYLMSQHNKCLELLNQSLALATEIGFDGLVSYIHKQLAITYNAKEDYNNSYKAFALCEELYGADKTYNSTNICGAAADTFAQKGYRAKSQQLLDKGWKLAANISDSIMMRLYSTRCLYHNKQEYAQIYNRALYSNLEILQNELNSPHAEIINAYFEQKHITKLEREHRNKWLLLAALLTTVALSLCFIAIRQYRYNRKLAEMSRTISQYAESNKSFEHDIANYKAEIGELNLSNFKEKFATIDHLCATYYQYIDSPKKQINIYKEVVSTIEELSNDSQMFANLEKDINNSFDNILLNLQAEYPNISNNEYKLACYICAGFSSQTICVLLKCDSDALYRRVYRLREKVRALNNNAKYSILLHK